jgi:hypothetical protein
VYTVTETAIGQSEPFRELHKKRGKQLSGLDPSASAVKFAALKHRIFIDDSVIGAASRIGGDHGCFLLKQGFVALSFSQ